MALEASGIPVRTAVSGGMNEAQNEAAYIQAIEQTVAGDNDALPRFLRSGGKVPLGKDFSNIWPAVKRHGRPPGSGRKESIQ